jgi:putative ABC transport system permease protein
MTRNYLKIAARNILKRKLYSFINAFGLSIGIAFCILIYLFIQDEKSFDQFHTSKDRIYRLHATSFDEESFKKGEKDPRRSHAYLPARLGEVLLDEIPEVEHMTRFNGDQSGTFRYKDKVFKEKVATVDSGFFRMFDFKLTKGDPARMFRNPSDAVITQEIANKYFGDEDPIGKIFTFAFNEELTFTVAGIIEAPPANSSLQFNILIPVTARPYYSRNREQWGAFSYPTFVQLKAGVTEGQFETAVDAITVKYMADRLKRWREEGNVPAEYKVFEFNFLPLAAIHNTPDIGWHKVSDPKYSWILGGIALMILVIASINYVSLALTTSASRRIEVGIRKVIGAQRRQLIYQFGLESVLLAFGSMFIGLAFAILFLPFFNDFTNKGIELTSVNLVWLLSVVVATTFFVGAVAGSYPSVFLSGFLPASVLKGGFTSRVQASFTKPLVVLQFFISASLIICSVIMYRQMTFIATKDLGFDKEHLIVMDAQSGFLEKAEQNVELFKTKLASNTNVLAAAGTSSSFNQGWSRYGYKIKEENKSAYVYRVDTDYVPLLKLEFVTGRNFDPSIPSDSTALIVNEALVKDMGWKDPLNEYLNWREDTVGIGDRVIGVVKDYHFLSLEQKIEPLFLSMDKKNVGNLTTILIKLKPGETQDRIASVKAAWTELFPDKPFEYTFVDEDVARQYESYDRWMKITGLSTTFAIIIACLGLFGLAGINALNRTKEIGIRKVMGAEVSNIFVLLNKQYIWLSMIAFVLAAPVSWYVMTEWWLESFQFKIVLGWELFAVSMLAGLAVALLTVSYHAVKAAFINPAETLKYE